MSTIPKLLIICGPTATGKTNLALSLAKKFNGELVSADSRQIYKEMDIGTGKDIPAKTKFKIQNPKLKVKGDEYVYGYYDIGSIPLWLLDVARPDQEFSVAHFHELALSVIENIHSREKLPIVVGGTGLYIKSLIEHIPTMSIPQDTMLRRTLSMRTAIELQHILQEIDPRKLASMNNSDRHNPRRLIRAIEIASSGVTHEVHSTLPTRWETLEIGLRVSPHELEERIKDRVEKRMYQGLIQEIEMLLKKGYSWNLPSMQTLGYKEWKNYFEKRKTKEDVMKEWIQDEIQYAKRQMTWFKKRSHIHWYDSSDSHIQEMLELAVEKWYTK